MYGLNAVALLFFIGIHLAANFLCTCEKALQQKVLRRISFLLLSFNLLRYGFAPLLQNGLKIPVEFSAVSYFLVPILVLFGRKKRVALGGICRHYGRILLLYNNDAIGRCYLRHATTTQCLYLPLLSWCAVFFRVYIDANRILCRKTNANIAQRHRLHSAPRSSFARAS
jgi:hypothetical protein